MATTDELYDEATALREAGNLEAAVEKLNEGLGVDPNHTLSHQALGVYLHKLGKLEDAILHAKKVVELEPEDAFSYTQLSVIYQRCGRIMEAEDAMAKAREIQMGGSGH